MSSWSKRSRLNTGPVAPPNLEKFFEDLEMDGLCLFLDMMVLKEIHKTLVTNVMERFFSYALSKYFFKVTIISGFTAGSIRYIQ